MMHCCVLCDKLRLLQWLNLFSSIFQFSLLLVALTSVLRRNDTLASAGIGAPCSTAILIILHSLTDSQTFSLFARESVVSPSAK
jgi:hypothetical protein